MNRNVQIQKQQIHNNFVEKENLYINGNKLHQSTNNFKKNINKNSKH